MEQKQDMISELAEMNSSLTQMPRHMPYSIPAGYFDTIHSQVMDTIANSEIILDIDNAHRSLPYQAPVAYFEQLPAAILTAAKNADKKILPAATPKTIWLRIRWAAAAILLLGIGVGSYSGIERGFFRPAKNTVSIPAVSQDDISEYVIQNIDEFDLDMISAQDINNLTLPTHDLKQNDIVQYLDETGWSTKDQTL